MGRRQAGPVFSVALLLWAALPTAAMALPSRQAAQACLNLLQAKGKSDPKSGVTVSSGGPACLALVKAAQDTSEGPIDADMAKSLPKIGPEALHDYLETLPAATFDRASTAAHGPPDPAAVPAILAELPDSSAEKPGFWQRLDAWLHRLLDRGQREANNDDSVLGRILAALLRSIPSSVSEALVWIVFGSMLLLVIVVVVREIRAGISGRPRGTRVAAAETNAIPAEIGAMPDHPVALLRWTIEVLARNGRLPDDPTLTNQELSRHLEKVARPRFRSLIRIAERALFGDLPAADAERIAARADADALIHDIGSVTS
jgi:hypothetical protein